MISVMQDFEILRNASTSVTATADRALLEMENSPEGTTISDGGYGGVSSERMVFPVVDSEESMLDLDVRVSGEGEERGFEHLEDKYELETDGGEEDMLSPVGGIRGSFIESGDWMHGYRVGDMVWGKVKSHPWWPGHIYNGAFASPSVQRMRGEGFVLVAFFGDSSFGWFDPAELIPFEPYFSEKSRQTTSRNFVRAVEEAVDEVSRRGALAVACRCRNPHNFRPTSVSGYFSVDVVGYEPGGLYSSMQIKEARDNFVPAELLSFMLQLTLGPRRNNGNAIEWIQTIAKLLAFRRSVFEEYDETYAQAFGVEPVRPSYDGAGVLDQTGRFAPRVAPLSGQLVEAEALGGRRRSSTRLATHKSEKAKRNKYVLKRREDLPAAVAGSGSFPEPHRYAFFPSFPDPGGLRYSGEHSVSGEPPASGLYSGYFLQRGEGPSSPSPSAVAAGDDKPKAEVFLPADYFQKPEPVEFKNEGGLESFAHYFPAEGSQKHDEREVLTKEKGLKRPPPEGWDESGKVKRGRKKKNKDGFSALQHSAAMKADHHRTVAGRSMGVAHSSYPGLVAQEDGINAELPPGLDLGSLQLPLLLNDLFAVAVDPFYAIEEDAPAIVRHVFIRFRSLVYQKSLILLGASDPPAPSQASAGRDAKGQREPSTPPHPWKPASKLVTKGVRKRDLSGRQEHLSVKKMKKIKQLKELASKKKAAMRQQRSSELQHQQQLQQKPKDQDSASTASAAEVSRKQELPPPPKHLSPTFLLMKFPPRSTLPSASNLKARFARFGPLEPEATRLYWKSFSCKILFKYKSDAQSAYDFAKNNDLFGQFKVQYTLRDLEVSALDQPPDAPGRPADPSREPPPNLHGSAGLQRPPSSLGVQSQLQLKSILKKPGGDESGPNGAAASDTGVRGGALAKESPRVKFMLKVDDNRSGNGGGQAILLEPFDQASRQALKSVGFSQLPPPPPSSSSPPLPQPQQPSPRGLEMHPHRIPPSSSFTFQHVEALPQPPSPLPQPPCAFPQQPRSAPGEKSGADISGPMLSLLLKCGDIVGKVKSSLGYTPYHAL